MKKISSVKAKAKSTLFLTSPLMHFRTHRCKQFKRKSSPQFSLQAKGKAVLAFLAVAVLLWSSVPFQAANASSEMSIATGDGRTFTGFPVSSSSFSTNLTAYEQAALTTRFLVNGGPLGVDNFDTDLISAWRTVGMGVALNGANGVAPYTWKDFSGQDKTIQNIMLTAGGSAGLSSNSIFNAQANTGYYGLKKFDKNYWCGTYCRFYNSGLQYAGSLNDASSAIEGTIRTGYTKDSDFKGGSPQHFDWGGQGATAQDVFYIDNGYAASSWNFTGKKRKDRFMHTGIFFYNFKITPYLDNGYDSEILNSDDPAYDEDRGLFVPEEALIDSDGVNTTDLDMPLKKVFEKSGEESTSSTITHSSTHTQTNGYSRSFELLGEKSWDKVSKFGFKSSCTYNMSVADSLSAGWSDTRATKSGFKESTEVQLIIPPHTRACITADYGHYYQTLKMKCPMCLSFDVSVVNWGCDPSDDDAPSVCGLVATFNNAGGAVENAQENLDQLRDTVWWSNILSSHSGISNFASDMNRVAQASRAYIPYTNQGISMTYARPAVRYKSTTFVEEGTNLCDLQEDLLLSGEQKEGIIDDSVPAHLRRELGLFS